MKKTIYTAYAEQNDITFIMEDLETDSGELIQTSVMGWYYGPSTEENTAYYIGKTTATY